MIYGDLITKIRYRLADAVESPNAYDDTMLIEFINDGIRDFAQIHCCQYTDVIQSGSTVSFIDPSSLTEKKILKVFAVRYAGIPLDFAPPWESASWRHASISTASPQGTKPTTGVPAGWTVWQKRVYLDASIATLSATNDLAIEYSYVPSDGGNSTVTSTFPLADAYSEAIVSFATGRAFAQDREGGLADREMQLYFASKKSAGDAIAEQVRGGYAA
jgi:hypothetical protein